MIHHSDAGVNTRPSGSPKPLGCTGFGLDRLFGNAYDNATAKTSVGLYKNEAVEAGSPFRTSPPRTLADVEILTLNYVR